MPYWGLVATSVGFLLPGIWAWRRRAWVDACASAVVTLTSVAYHSTQHPVAHAIDVAIAHTCGAIGIVRSVASAVRRRSRRRAAIAANTMAGVAIYLVKSRNNTRASSARWHMLFHVMCQSAWMAQVRLNLI